MSVTIPHILAMAGNPIADIRATGKVDFVHEDGVVYRDPRGRSQPARTAEGRKESRTTGDRTGLLSVPSTTQHKKAS